MSAYTITLENAKNDIALKQISGVCSSSAQFLALINEAQKSLAIRGGWFDLQQRIKFCLSGCHVVWPHFVGTVLGVRFCDGLATMQNQWYSFVNNDMGQNWNAAYGLGTGYGNGFDGYGNTHSGSMGARCVIEDAGTRPCYNEITGTTGKLIRYNIVKGNDIGKKITLFGKKFGAQPLQEQDSSGAWIMGSTITFAIPFGTTTDLVTVIDSITRDETEGMAYLYEYDASTNKLRDLAVFQPYETNPRYRCSRILNMPTRGVPDANGVCWTSIEALVKLKFIELKHDRDFLPISNLRATKLAIQAIKLEESGNDQAALTKWTLAVEELALELEDLQPKKQIPVRMNLGRAVTSPI